MKYSLKAQERIDLIEDTGVHGLVLFEYYLRMASVENVEITDENAAEYFGWNIHTAKRWRRKLIKAGWVYMDKARAPNGDYVFRYFLGKSEVTRSRSNT